MPGKYVAAGLAIVIDALIVAIAIAVVALLYWLVTGAGGDYMVILSDVLFFAGGVILTFGALVAFFKVGKTQEIRRLMLNPLRPLDLRGAILNVGEDYEHEGEQEAGWLLIFLGATLIVFSFITSIGYLI
jgi:hypothetical protein